MSNILTTRNGIQTSVTGRVEKRIEPPKNVPRANGLAQSAHVRLALRPTHVAGMANGIRDPIDIMRIDQQSMPAQPPRSPGKFAEDEDSIVVDVSGTVLLGDQVHAIFERRNERNVRSAVKSDELAAVKTTE